MCRLIFSVMCVFLLFPDAGAAGKIINTRPAIENPYEINIPLLQQKLEPDQIILKFSLLKNAGYVFFYRRNSMGFRRLNITTPGLIDLINRLTGPLDDFTRGNVDYLRLYYDLHLARQLYALLLKDILETGKKEQVTRELFIIPDGELFKLPFEALVTGFKRQAPEPGTIFSEYASANYLIQDYRVSYFFSLFDILKRGRFATGINKYAITAFGSPSVQKSNENCAVFRDLPAAREEILSISTIFGKTKSRIFLADLCNRRNFENIAPHSRIIHIATHFVNNVANPQCSALVFSSLNKDAPFDFYYAADIFKLKLNAALVVLSACETAEKHLEGMPGLKGMTASFRKAGARAAIVSMWPVDEYNSRVIPLFYRQSCNGKPNAAALRAAKLLFMKETAVIVPGVKISFAHPFLWANYVLYHFDGGNGHQGPKPFL